MTTNSSKTSIDLNDSLRLKLRCFLKASDASMAKIVRRAIEEHIDRELERNAGVNERYQQEKAQFLATAGNNITLIQHRKPRKKVLFDSSKIDAGTKG